MDTLEQAYDAAMAVLTAPMTFVEWTTLKVNSFATPDPMVSDDWSPLGIWMHYGADEYEWEPTGAIEGERYIYVFSRRAWSTDTPTLVEELHLKENGQIEAASLGPRKFPDPARLDGKDSPLPEKRKWNAVGTNIRFVRRWRGARMLHYFFASRIPLSRRYIEELRQNVAMWVPPTMFDDYTFVLPTTSSAGAQAPRTFGEWDANLATDLDTGALKVPVLDPLTVALHLHLLASSASNDLYDYMTVDEDGSADAREHVENRQRKLVLAYVVQLVLKSYDTSYGSPMYTVSQKADAFIRQYWEQVNHRIQENDRWWFYLSNWFQSDPIRFLSRAHFESPDPHWPLFLLPMLLCLVDANSSAPGRELLQILAKGNERFKWFRREVLEGLESEPIEDETAAKYQLPRKFALAVLETQREMAPYIVKIGGTQAMFRVLAENSKKFNIWIMADGTQYIADPNEAAKVYVNSVQKLGFKAPHEEELLDEWEKFKEHTYHHYSHGKLRVIAIVELIDLTLSLRQFLEEKSALNTITLARSIADTSAMLLEFAHGKKGKIFHKLFSTRPYVVVIAGVLEVAAGIIEATHAAAKHDPIGETSALITVTGAAFSTVGFAAAAFVGASTTPFIVIGLVVMSLGALVGFFKDTNLDTCLKFCAFGDDGGGGELVTGLEEMKRGEYGQQLEVLLNLLCAFKIERADEKSLGADSRMARFTMGWFTEKSYLQINYEDEWFVSSQSGGVPALTKRVDFGGAAGMTLSPDRFFDLNLSQAPPFNPSTDDVGYKAHFEAQLHVVFDQFEFVVPPKPKELWITVGDPAGGN